MSENWIDKHVAAFRERKKRDEAMISERQKETEIFEEAIDPWWEELVSEIREAVTVFSSRLDPDDRMEIEEVPPSGGRRHRIERGIRILLPCRARYYITVDRDWGLSTCYGDMDDENCPQRYRQDGWQRTKFAVRTKRHDLVLLNEDGNEIPKERRAEAILTRFFSTV